MSDLEHLLSVLLYLTLRDGDVAVSTLRGIVEGARTTAGQTPMFTDTWRGEVAVELTKRLLAALPRAPV